MVAIIGQVGVPSLATSLDAPRRPKLSFSNASSMSKLGIVEGVRLQDCSLADGLLELLG